MTENQRTLEWTHLRPIRQELEDAGVIHTPAFPSLEGYVCYYPFPQGYKQLKLAHRLNGETDITLKKIEASPEQYDKAISTKPFPSSHWETGQLETWLWERNTARAAIFEKELRSSLGENLFQKVIEFINKELNHIKDLAHLLDLYHEEIKKLEQQLPPFLMNRYKMNSPNIQEPLTPESHYNISLYLFGGYAYHIMNDLHDLGYNLTSLDFENRSLSLSLQEKRTEITIQWAKDYTNAILMTKQKVGYQKAMTGAERFLQFCKTHSYIGELPSLGGQLNDLADTLIASCKMGIVKEGILQKNWDSKRIVKEWRKVAEQFPIAIKDSILIGSPMETLYSFTVNTVAWLEAKGEYDDSHEIICSYLTYYEKRLQSDYKKDKELSTTLAASFYTYLKKNNQLEADDFPAILKLSKSKRTPFRQLAQVYKPRQRITTGTKGFFHYISRGNGNRIMGTSIGLSLLLMLVIYFVF